MKKDKYIKHVTRKKLENALNMIGWHLDDVGCGVLMFCNSDSGKRHPVELRSNYLIVESMKNNKNQNSIIFHIDLEECAIRIFKEEDCLTIFAKGCSNFFMQIFRR